MPASQVTQPELRKPVSLISLQSSPLCSSCAFRHVPSFDARFCTLQLSSVGISDKQKVYILGSARELGNWNPTFKVVFLEMHLRARDMTISKQRNWGHEILHSVSRV